MVRTRCCTAATSNGCATGGRVVVGEADAVGPAVDVGAVTLVVGLDEVVEAVEAADEDVGADDAGTDMLGADVHPASRTPPTKVTAERVRRGDIASR